MGEKKKCFKTTDFVVRCKLQISLFALCFYHYLWDFKQVADFLTVSRSLISLYHLPCKVTLHKMIRESWCCQKYNFANIDSRTVRQGEGLGDHNTLSKVQCLRECRAVHIYSWISFLTEQALWRSVWLPGSLAKLLSTCQVDEVEGKEKQNPACWLCWTVKRKQRHKILG